MKNLFVIIVFLLSSALYADWDNEQKLTASDAAANDHFGNSVSIDGDYVLIGAVGDEENGYAYAAAYVFYRDGSSWIQQDKLTASDGTVEDMFGNSVSISGDYAVIGAFGADDIINNRGAAYIFHRSGTNWTQQARISAYDADEDDWFGWSVSIDGDYVVIGAVEDDDNGSSSGSAYIFHRNGTSWILQSKITASDGATFDDFGNSVSISGDYAVIGALWDDDNGSGSGSAYIFHRNGITWMEKAKITASDGAEDDWFGKSVSISGDYTIIGAYGDDDNDSRSGSAYIFQRSGTNWMEQAKIIASDGELFDNFGYSVSISGDYAVIGAGFNGDNGAAYIFHRNGISWMEQTKLTASDGETDDWFGKSVSISGSYAVIGAWQDDDNGDGSGSAYLYTYISPQSCLPEGITFSTQEEIDNFQSEYPNCIEIEGAVVIGGDKIKNDDIVNLNVLNILTSIEGHISIKNNNYLESLSGLNNVTSIGGYLIIEANNALTSLMGLDNINAGSISELSIAGNTSLSTCEVQSICDYLASPSGEIDIHDNAPGCNSQQEVEEACAQSVDEVSIINNLSIHPNPFTNSTTIEYELIQPDMVTMTIYNHLGKQIEVIRQKQSAGKQQVVWDAEGMPSGVYFCVLKTNEGSNAKKFIKN